MIGLRCEIKENFIINLNIYSGGWGEDYKKTKAQILAHTGGLLSATVIVRHSLHLPHKELYPMLPKHLSRLRPGGVFKVTGLLVPCLPY